MNLDILSPSRFNPWMALPKKKKVDYEALTSPLMQIPSMDVKSVRDLIDIGIREIYHLEGRAPETLFDEIRKQKPDAPQDRLPVLKMAVYFAETTDPDPKRLYPHVWA